MMESAPGMSQGEFGNKVACVVLVHSDILRAVSRGEITKRVYLASRFCLQSTSPPSNADSTVSNNDEKEDPVKKALRWASRSLMQAFSSPLSTKNSSVEVALAPPSGHVSWVI